MYDRYYIQPGDEQIRFQVPLTLYEIKSLYSCVVDRAEKQFKEGYTVDQTQDLLKKLQGLINYLHSEHYQNP